MGYTKKIEQYVFTETVIYQDGREVAREENNDTYWYDTVSDEHITEEEA